MVHVDRDDDVARLTRAIEHATQAGEWTLATRLIGQLERITRAAAGNVVELEAARRSRRH